MAEVSRATVDLCDWPHLPPVLIIEAPTGVFYTNQTGVTYCAHPVVEGYLDRPDTELVHWVLDDGERWRDGFRDDWYNCGEYSAFTDDEAARLATKGFPMEHFDVERAKTLSWGEAWIPVKLADGRKAILSYENSD